MEREDKNRIEFFIFFKNLKILISKKEIRDKSHIYESLYLFFLILSLFYRMCYRTEEDA